MTPKKVEDNVAKPDNNNHCIKPVKINASYSKEVCTAVVTNKTILKLETQIDALKPYQNIYLISQKLKKRIIKSSMLHPSTYIIKEKYPMK